MPDLPPLYRYADALLEGKLADRLTEWRDAGDSWDTIAKRLWAETDERVNITSVTAQGWFERATEAAA